MIFTANKVTTRYTFNKKDYQNKIVFLKRLKNGKIFFDNKIYDKDFFYYKRLRKCIKNFYIYQYKYIIREFDRILEEYNKNKLNMSFYERYKYGLKVKYYNPKKKIIKNLTKEQYDVLVNAFTFNFTFGRFDAKLISYYLYREGWYSIRPVYNIFSEPEFTNYNEYDEYFDVEDYDIDIDMIYSTTNRTVNLRKKRLGFFGTMFYAFYEGFKLRDRFFVWLYNERDDEYRELRPNWIKYFKEIKHRYKHTNNIYFKIKYRFKYLRKYQSKIENLDDEEDFVSGYLEHMRKYDYELRSTGRDLEKKYNEFDFYSTTNTRARFIMYNEVYYKDYKGKKFVIGNHFDYTEEEIKFNYDNAVNNTGLNKLETALSLYKNVTYLNEFLEILNDKYSDNLSELVRGYKWCKIYHRRPYPLFMGKEFYDKKEYDFQRLIYDPKYILILPVLDAYFEMFKYDTGAGYDTAYSLKRNFKIPNLEHKLAFDQEAADAIQEKNDKIKFTYHYTEYEDWTWQEKMICELYIKTLDYKHDNALIYNEDIIGSSWYEDDMQDYQEEYGDDLWYYWFVWVTIIGTVAIVTYYSFCYLGFFLKEIVPASLTEPMYKIKKIHEVHLNLLKENKGPKILFELAHRKRKARYLQGPCLKLYFDLVHQYPFKHGVPRNDVIPLIDVLRAFSDSEDFSLRTYTYILNRIGVKMGFARMRIPFLWETPYSYV